MTSLFIASRFMSHDGSRRMVAAVLLDAGDRGACASVDPDLAASAGLGVYGATMGLLLAASAGRQQRAGIEAVKRAGRDAWEKHHGGAS